jgi:hypothetical protein
MKFFCCFLVLFQIGIKAEPPSLSFINLIPSIIANGRFVKEHIVDSGFNLNSTLPSVHVDLTFNINQSNCSRDIHLLSRDLLSRQIWALKSKIIF